MLASGARVLWRLLERNGIDADEVFRHAKLDPALLAEPRARYPVENARAAWREAARLIDDPCFGLQAIDVWRPTDFHALGYAFLASRNLLTAIGRIVRYNAVVDTIVLFESELDDNELRLTYRIERPDLPDIPALQEARWAIVLGMCRTIGGNEVSPRLVCFTHDAPPCTSEHFGLFRCPVEFRAPVSRLVFDRTLVERPLSAANRELAQANDAALAAYVAELDQHNLVARAKAVIVEQLPSGTPSAQLIAKELYLSPRTLQRRLAAAGTSLSEVVETVRRELAEQYLADPSRTLSEIGFLLGFSEQSAFSRAFRRWTGQAPSEVRDSAN
jgi:AraC-like DNA-binding protein